MFDNLSTDGLEKTKDTLGGFAVRKTDVYKGVIRAIYAGQADSGAKNVTVVLTLEDGSEYSETVYVTNKQGQNWYPNKQDATKQMPLPGFTRINELFLAVTGKPINQQVWVDKTFKVWNKDAGEAMPTVVKMAEDALNKEVLFTLTKEIVDKTTKQGNEYVPTGETREQNVFTQVFDPKTRKSVNEAIDGKDATFLDAWLNRNKGKVFDKTSAKKNGGKSQGGTAGRPPASGAGTAESAAQGASIFGGG